MEEIPITHMQANDIFREAGSALAEKVLGYFREQEREVYRTTLASLAQQRRLRPVFVQRKPAAEQMAWMGKELTHRRNESLAEQVLQVWLMNACEPMLVRFLDDLGVEHDGKGAVDDLPEDLGEDALAKAVDDLLREFEPLHVAVYLRVFQMQKQGGWPALSALLETDQRLALGGQP